uniref:Proteasome subunit beta n=1 Tax=Serinus canaria TaxID=9135 RepID=A0A8C9MU23_SERCA
MSYNGGAVMAMRGRGCVAIAADRRFGVQAQTVTTDFQKIFPMGQRLYIGLAGLATDVQTVAQRLKFRLNLYELKEGRQIKPQTFMSMVSNLLYERRFGPYYTEPVIAGLDPLSHEPFICSLDLIGCPMVTDDFVVSGTCSEQMYGMCESLWEPDMVSGAGVTWDSLGSLGISWDPWIQEFFLPFSLEMLSWGEASFQLCLQQPERGSLQAFGEFG